MVFQKKYAKRFGALALTGVLVASIFSGCGSKAVTNGGQSASADSGSAAVTASGSSETAASVAASPAPVSAAVDTEGAGSILLNGTGATVSGTGVSFSDGVVTVTAGGTYTVSGTLTEGRILIDAKGEDVTLVLDGADITCSYGSPIYCYKAASLTLHLPEGSESTLTDGSAYSFSDSYSSAEEEEPNACLYSKADLVIQGSGSLTVNGNYNNGITSKDSLEIIDAGVTVTAVNHGITGKDSADLSGASLTVSCGGDALRSTQTDDSSLGWVRLSDCSLTLNAGEDGIQAETVLLVSGSSCTITTGGGHGSRPSDAVSAKGLKAGTEISVSSGSFTLDCSDDAVHSNGTVSVNGGSWTVSSYDDALHADERLTVSGGEIVILSCYEGLESGDITVSGGSVTLTSSDDGVNAGGGADESGFGGYGGFGGGGRWGGGTGTGSVTISGGALYITAGGDGLDSNGSITMSGGTVIVSCSGSGDGALDYDGSFALSGGTFLAMGGGMPAAPNSVSQSTVYVSFGGTLAKGTAVALESGDWQYVFELPVNASTFVFSSPELQSGAELTVSYGGNYSGSFENCVGSGGSWSGGTVLTTLTLTDGLSSYGSAGFGGMGGGFGGGMTGQGGMGGMGRGGGRTPTGG